MRQTARNLHFYYAGGLDKEAMLYIKAYSHINIAQDSYDLYMKKPPHVCTVSEREMMH